MLEREKLMERKREMEPTNISLPGWELGKAIGKGGFGSVYEIHRDVFGHVETCALKTITIPQEQGQIEFMRLTGMDDDSIVAHLQSQVKSFLDEYNIMLGLRDNPHIVHCYDFQHTSRADKLSWTILIRMELLTPLTKVMEKVSTEAQIIQLGLDMCDALMACQDKKIIHRDIKPQNIFVADNGSFKLGDFGISKILEDATRANTQAGTLTFMAPEIAAGKRYDSTVDIYSLGLVLYWLLNHRRGPFMPLPPKVPSFSQDQEALVRRLQGDKFDPPSQGSAALKQIVMKACSFEPEKRYRTAREMHVALKALTEKPTVKKNTIDPPKPIAFVLTCVDYTGGSSFRYFRDTEEVGIASFTTNSHFFSLNIQGRSMQLQTMEPNGQSIDPEYRELVYKGTSDTFAAIYPVKDGKSRITTEKGEYTAEKVSNGWHFLQNGNPIAMISKVHKGQNIWTPRQKALYEDPIRGSAPRYLMRGTYNLPDELILLFLTYPMLEYTNTPPVQKEVVDGPRFEPPRTTERVFYLDEHHNFVPEDQAVKRVIQILDENGNMIQEIWQDRVKPEKDISDILIPPDPLETRERYVDAQGREVPKEKATHVIIEQYIIGELVSSEKVPLSGPKGQGNASRNAAVSGDTIELPQLMLIRGRAVDMTDIEKTFNNPNIKDSKVMTELIQSVYCKVGNISLFAAAELVRFYLDNKCFPKDYETEIPLFRKYAVNRLTPGAAAMCNVNGITVDLADIQRDALMVDFSKAAVGDILVSRLRSKAPGLSANGAHALILLIIATGMVPEYFDHPGAAPASADSTDQGSKKNKGLDIYGTLELKYQPSSKERVRTVTVEGQEVKLTLPSSVPVKGKEFVVKNAGRKDPITGETGDAHITVTCKSSFYAPNSLGNILYNIFLVIAFVIYIVFVGIKKLVTSKFFIVVVVLAAIALAVKYYLLR